MHVNPQTQMHPLAFQVDAGLVIAEHVFARRWSRSLTVTTLTDGSSGGGSPHALLDGSTHTDTAAQTVTRGSLIYGNSTPAWDELILGASGLFVGSNGVDASWTQIDHGAHLAGLSDDDHSQYVLLAGRGGGQTLTGGTASGNELRMRSTSNATKGDIDIAYDGGNVVIGGGATASRLRMLEASGSGTNYTEFVVQPQTANITYTLPPDDGDAGEFLKTDGAGSLTWETYPAASDTVAGVIEIAIQSEQETGTDVVRAVTPGRQHYHPSAVKGWCNFTGGAGTAALQSPDYNVDTLSETATGDFTVAWVTDFSSDVYAASGICQRDTASDNILLTVRGQSSSIQAASLRVATINTGGTKIACVFGMVMACGDHA